MDRAELSGLAQAVANALGGEWYTKVDDDNWSRAIYNRQDKKVLYVSVSGNKGKETVHVHGSLHVGENGQYVQVYDRGSDGTGWYLLSVPDIGVSLSRGAEVVAKEIKRRLLPEYDRILALALAQVQRDKEYKDAKRANLERMANAAGVTLPVEDSPYRDPRESFSVRYGEVYGDVRAYEKDVEIKLHGLSALQAERLLQVLRGKELN